MATVSQAVKKAMRLMSILQVGEEPSAEEAQDATESMNDMLHAWELDGITLNHVDLSYEDTLPYPEHHIKTISYNLAIELAAEFGKTAPASVVVYAENGYRNLQNYYLDLADLSVDSAINSYYNPNGNNY